MDAILTLVAPPAPAAQPSRLPPEAVDAAVAGLAAGGAVDIGDADRFADGRAADIAFRGDPWDAGLADAVRGAVGPLPLDYAIQPASPRQKALLIADMDSTVVTTETLDDMADAAGIGEAVAAITRRAMNGELDFAAALKERVGLLAGMDAVVLDRALAVMAITPGAAELVRGMTGAGAECRLVSGGFAYFVGRVAKALGFDGWQSNDIEIVDGKLTGRVVEPILDGSAKVTALDARAAALGIGMAAVATVGDGANDVPMLARAGLGVAWRAKPSVAAGARARIDHGDLSTLLTFQRMDPA